MKIGRMTGTADPFANESATVLDDRENWQEVRFSRELAEATRRDDARGEYTVQIVRRGRGPVRTGKGRYP